MRVHRSTSSHRALRARRGLTARPGRSAALAFSLFAGAVVSPAPIDAQSAAAILSDAMERHDARLSGVEDVTIRQEVMGIATSAHMVKDVVDGHALLRPVEVDLAGAKMNPVDDAGELWASPHQLFVDMADRWVLEGRGSVEGRESWSLSLTDTEGLDWGGAPGQEGDFHPNRLDMQLAVDDLVPLVMTIDGEVTIEGETRPVSVRMSFSDYREVDGYLHPFLTTMETDLAAAGMSEAELEEARRGLEEARRALEEAPEAQRAMIERMMGSQIEMLEDMIAGESIRMEIRVTDLQVNAGR